MFAPATRGDDVSDTYWKECRAVNPHLELNAICRAVDILLGYSRPVGAIGALSLALRNKLNVEFDLLCRSLESLLNLPKPESERQFQRMDSYHIQQIIAELQGRTDIANDRMIQIEWHFIRLLDEHSLHSPKTLHKHRSQSPGFFDEQQLLDWCSKARELAISSGRIEVCDVQIGEMLARCTIEDDDGSWPCHAIRNVIEAISTDPICSGLSCGIHNSRGATSRNKGGNQERDLSSKYRDLAKKVRYVSPTTARVLDGVADSYEREAGRWDELERWGD